LEELLESIVCEAKQGVRIDALLKTGYAIAESMGYDRFCVESGRSGVTINGHGIGLELIEQPLFASQQCCALEAGMAVALELSLFQGGALVSAVKRGIAITETGNFPIYSNGTTSRAAGH
jgi:hypothetical protein